MWVGYAGGRSLGAGARKHEPEEVEHVSVCDGPVPTMAGRQQLGLHSLVDHEVDHRLRDAHVRGTHALVEASEAAGVVNAANTLSACQAVIFSGNRNNRNYKNSENNKQCCNRCFFK